MPKSAVTPQVICLFGAPGVGVTTIARVFGDATSAHLFVAADTDAAESHFRDGALVFLDGLPKSGPDLQDLVDRGLISAARGKLVRLWTDDELLNQRRAAAGKPLLSLAEFQAFYHAVTEIEEVVRIHNLDYSMVPNGDPLNCVLEVARIAGVRD